MIAPAFDIVYGALPGRVPPAGLIVDYDARRLASVGMGVVVFDIDGGRAEAVAKERLHHREHPLRRRIKTGDWS